MIELQEGADRARPTKILITGDIHSFGDDNGYNMNAGKFYRPFENSGLVRIDADRLMGMVGSDG